MLSFITFILGTLLALWLTSVIDAKFVDNFKNSTKLLILFSEIIILAAAILFAGRNFIFPKNLAFPFELCYSEADRTERFNAEYKSVMEQIDTFSRDTTFRVISSETIYKVDSLNNRISELNTCIKKCKKHYKSDWWNGRFYPKEIADKQPITQKIASELYARFGFEDKK